MTTATRSEKRHASMRKRSRGSGRLLFFANLLGWFLIVVGVLSVVVSLWQILQLADQMLIGYGPNRLAMIALMFPMFGMAFTNVSLGVLLLCIGRVLAILEAWVTRSQQNAPVTIVDAEIHEATNELSPDEN